MQHIRKLLKFPAILLTALSLLVLLPGCIFNDTTLQLNPKINAPDKASAASNHDKLQITAEDARANKAVGFRRNEGFSGYIFISDDLKYVIENNIVEIAKANGFEQADKANRSLDAKLLLLSGGWVQESLTMPYKAQVAIEVIAKNNNLVFDHIYHNDINSGIAMTFTPDSFANKQLNLVLEGALNKIYQDEKLWEFLHK